MATDFTTLKRHGITKATPDGLLLDAGAIYFNLDLANVATAVPAFATQGGSDFDTGRSLRNIDVDGALGPVKGLVRVDTVSPKLSTKPLNLTVATLQKAIAGAVVTAGVELEKHDTITGGEIKLTDYIDNVTFVGTLSGKPDPVIIVLENCLMKEALKLTTAPKSEAIPSLTFEAHFDPENLDKEPWKILWPKDDPIV